MHGPSETLKQHLHDFGLCSSTELKRCATDVRRLCAELPDFDSVWLDALVRIGRLTPWQAQVLRSDDPSTLKVDRFVLSEPLGRRTWLATAGQRQRSVVLRQLDPDGGPYDVDEIRRLIEDVASSATEHPVPTSLCLPREVVQRNSDVFLASPFVSGYSADELILRGGRLPETAVQSIGMNLLQALQWLENTGHWHGRIALRHVRLTAEGQVVLVAPLVGPLEQPQLSFGDDLQLQDVEAVAPELVSTGRRSTAASELYSTGVVLWQLLAARSPFLTTDPVNRILKAQQEDVPDVQTLVPDCPAWLSTTLQKLTRRNPGLRPESVRTVARQWAQSATAGRAAVRRIVTKLPDRTLHRPAAAASGRQLALRGTVVAALLAGFAAIGMQRDLIPLPLNIPNPRVPVRTVDLQQADPLPESSSPASFEVSPLGFRVLPTPDAAGVVTLESGQTYEATSLAFAGSMHVEPSGTDPVRVVVPPGQSWTLQARQISLTDVVVQHHTAKSRRSSSVPLLQTRCDVLAIRKCTFSSERMSAAVEWSSATDHVGVIRWNDVAVAGSGYALNLLSAAQRCELDNTLLLASAGAVRLDTDGQQSLPPLSLRRVTQAAGHSLVDVFSSAAARQRQELTIEAGESVLVPATALVRWAGADKWTSEQAMVRFVLPERGNPTVVPPDVNTAVVLDRSLQQLVALAEQQIVLESLLLAEPEFLRPPDQADFKLSDFANFEVLDYAGPKLNADLPGCDVSRLLPPTLPEPSHADRSVSTAGR